MQDYCPACKTPVLPVARFCHACGAPIAGIRPRAAVRRRLLWTTLGSMWVAWGSWAGLASALALRQDDAVVVACWSVLVFNILSVLTGLMCGYPFPVLLGWGYLTVGVLLIIVCEISREVGTAAFVVYAVIALPLTYWATRCRPVLTHPWVCRRYGYLLYGLREPTCPECGLAFDPVKVMEKLPPGGQR